MSKRYGRNQKRKHLEQIRGLLAIEQLNSLVRRRLAQERDAAQRDRLTPLHRLSEKAIERLAGYTAEAVVVAETDFLKHAMTELSKIARRDIEIASAERPEDCYTVFEIVIPRTVYHFRPDLQSLATSGAR